MPETLLDRLKRTARLPTPPGTALEILRLCQQDDVSISQLADTLAADPALSLRLLKYANSAMFGVSREIASVRDAVLMLGVRSVRLMSLSFSLLSRDDERACKGFDFTLFWSHSLALAVSARHLSKSDHGLSPEESFATGLLSQLGKLVFAVGMPEEYPEILTANGGTLGATAEQEKVRFGVSYYELGADLIEDWGIPTRLASTIRHQRSPEALSDEPALAQFAQLIATAADLADVVCANGTLESLEELKNKVVSGGFLDASQFDQILSAIRGEFAELAQTLNLRSDFSPDVKRIQAEAGEVLGELSLATQLKSEEIEKENKGLQEQVWKDGLTGISNRAAFDLQLTKLWDDALRAGRPLALILLDVDHFKKFNDSYGHRTGDAVLKAVASCLPRSVRQVDFVARYGGEEFAVILPRVDRLILAQICVKIRKMIEANEVTLEDKTHKVTVSLGATLLTKVCKPYTSQQLIESSDQQLYTAKGRGRNCCSMRQIEPGTARMAQPNPAEAVTH